jgi:hypothetical protein
MSLTTLHLHAMTSPALHLKCVKLCSQKAMNIVLLHADSAAAPKQDGQGRRAEVLLGGGCGNMSVDVLPRLKVEQRWKPGRFMHDVKHKAALVTQLTIERRGAKLSLAMIAFSHVHAMLSTWETHAVHAL